MINIGYIYRYTDLADKIIKYVGIVWSEDRTLKQRVNEHERYDDWCRVRRWKIEYIYEDINTRSEAEAFEAHYISLYETDKYFNVKKTGWGTNKFLPLRNDWGEYVEKSEKIDRESSLKKSKNDLSKLITAIENKEKIIKEQEQIIKQNMKLIRNSAIILNTNKCITLDVGEVLDRLQDKQLLFHDFQFGITSKLSIAKWGYREEGVRTAICIIEDALQEKCLAV